MNATASAINAASISEHPIYNNTFLPYLSTVTVVKRVATNLNNEIAMAAIDDTPMSLKTSVMLLFDDAFDN